MPRTRIRAGDDQPWAINRAGQSGAVLDSFALPVVKFFQIRCIHHGPLGFRLRINGRPQAHGCSQTNL